MSDDLKKYTTAYEKAREIPGIKSNLCEYPFTVVKKDSDGSWILLPEPGAIYGGVPAYFWASEEEQGNEIRAYVLDHVPSQGERFLAYFYVDEESNTPKHLIVENTLPYPENNSEDVVRLLFNSWRFKFLGVEKKRLLFATYKGQTIDAISTAPEAIMGLLGIGKKRALRLAREGAFIKENWNTIRYLLKNGVKTNELDIIVDILGNYTTNSKRSDVFKILSSRNVSRHFRTRLFNVMNVYEKAKRDLPSVAVELLNMVARKDGNSSVPLEIAIDACVNEFGVTRKQAKQAIDTLIAQGKCNQRLMWDTQTISIGETKKVEEEFAEVLAERINSAGSAFRKASFAPIERPNAPPIVLNEAQQAAVQAALLSSTCIITGGPGTGKTTMLTGLIQEIKEQYPGGQILMACPTGKAARRMTEATGLPATTMHRMLGLAPDTASLMSKFSLRDTLIIDETSMMDTALLASAIKQMGNRGRLIMLGDPEQLASIEYGAVLQDMILSGLLTACKLEKVQRTSADSEIVKAAYNVISGALPDEQKEGSDFLFIEADTEEEIVAQIRSLCREIPHRYGIDSHDIQVLAAMRKGLAGVNNLNEELKPIFNANAAKPGEAMMLGYQVYHVGDRVMQLKNRYDLDIQNGEVGTIKEFDESNRQIIIQTETRDVKLPFGNYPHMNHSWCSTIHKSQGSEYEAVIVSLPESHDFMLNRKTLYTAITRGKKLVVVVGSKATLEKCIKKEMNSFGVKTKEGMNIERLSHLPYTIAEEICEKSSNKHFHLMAKKSKSRSALKKTTIKRADDIEVPF